VVGDEERAGEVGVFFAPKAGGTAVRIAPERLSPNSVGELRFLMLSEVTAGEWDVSVATQASTKRNQTVREVRTYTFPRTITVV
jgi:hypothetical protein